MNLKSSRASHACKSGASRRGMRALAQLSLMLAGAAPAAQSLASDEAVYVAGRGTSVEQAFNQALTNTAHEPNDRFWVVVSGGDVRRVTRGRADKDVLAWVQRVREQGGMVYVCRGDLAREGIREDELLDGVAEIYSYDKKDWSGLLPARKEGIILPESMRQSQLILKTCAGEELPES